MKTSKHYYGVTLKDVLMILLIQFPLSSILKVYIGVLNRLITAVCFVLFLVYFTSKKVSRTEFFLLAYAVLSIAVNAFMCHFTFYNANLLFYFPFMICYFIFFYREKDYIIDFFLRFRKYIDGVLLIWSVVLIISFFLPSSYVVSVETGGRSFISFTNTTFLLVPISIYVFALFLVQGQLYNKKIFKIALILPSLCVLLGSTRTYLVPLYCEWLVFIYVNLKNKKKIVLAAFITLCVVIIVVLFTPIKDKFIATFNRMENGMDTSVAFTSGRSQFWEYDLEQALQRPFLNIIFGSGSEYLFNINRERFHNPLWAHNDFIQVFADFGIVGLFVYFFIFVILFKKMLRGSGVHKLMVVIVALMAGFVAYWNMFYTYFNTVLSFPFFLLLLRKPLADAPIKKRSNFTFSKKSLFLQQL